jgi:surfeit locus 1 family protein
LHSSTGTEPKRDRSIAPDRGAALRSLFVPGVVVLAALLALVSLGNWQVRRLGWKEALIASASERPKLPPLDWRDEQQRNLVDTPNFSEDYNYRRIRLDGEYLPEKEARVFTSLPADLAKGEASGPGYLIMTPFQLADANYAVWVNRGFVPEGSSWAPPPAGRVILTGLVRPDDPPHWLTPENQPGKNLFFSRSVAVLSEAKDLPLNGPEQPFTVDLAADAMPPGGLPQAGETRMAFTNNHLQYAITWYGLAAALLAVFAAFVMRRLRDTSDERLTRQGEAP